MRLFLQPEAGVDKASNGSEGVGIRSGYAAGPNGAYGHSRSPGDRHMVSLTTTGLAACASGCSSDRLVSELWSCCDEARRVGASVPVGGDSKCSRARRGSPEMPSRRTSRLPTLQRSRLSLPGFQKPPLSAHFLSRMASLVRPPAHPKHDSRPGLRLCTAAGDGSSRHVQAKHLTRA